MVGRPPLRRTTHCMLQAALCIVVALLAAGHAQADQAAQQQAPDAKTSNAVSTTAAAAAANTGKASSSSACAKQCFETAKQLGFDKVAGDSMACFLPYKGKRLSTYDCCDKAELLFGAYGEMANCLCCPEFAKAMLDAVPYTKLEATPKEYLEKLHLCRVPIVGQSTCQQTAQKPPKESAFVSTASTQAGSPAPASPASPASASNLTPRPIISTFNLTGLYPWFGFDTKFDPGVLAAQGQAAIQAGQISQVRVVGASDLYNDYLTGFVLWIEREAPRYNTPKVPDLPPLPDQYKDDVLWVANLRRGPYPDLVKNRPERFSPKNTDPLQNGQIANLPPGPAFAGRFSQFNGPNGK